MVPVTDTATMMAVSVAESPDDVGVLSTGGGVKQSRLVNGSFRAHAVALMRVQYEPQSTMEMLHDGPVMSVWLH
jgi:hypothetical protein